MKDDLVGKVDEHTAMIKATITNPEKMEKVAERIPQIAPKLGLEHDMYTLTKMRVIKAEKINKRDIMPLPGENRACEGQMPRFLPKQDSRPTGFQ